jgi:hypothetical protein
MHLHWDFKVSEGCCFYFLQWNPIYLGDPESKWYWYKFSRQFLSSWHFLSRDKYCSRDIAFRDITSQDNPFRDIKSRDTVTYFETETILSIKYSVQRWDISRQKTYFETVYFETSHLVTFHFETLNYRYRLSRDKICHFKTVAGVPVIFCIPLYRRVVRKPSAATKPDFQGR